MRTVGIRLADRALVINNLGKDHAAALNTIERAVSRAEPGLGQTLIVTSGCLPTASRSTTSCRGPSSATTPSGTWSRSCPKRTRPRARGCPHSDYVAGLVGVQRLGLAAAQRRVLSPTEWEAASALFLGDLHIDPDDLFKPDRLAIAYAGALDPQLAIARTIGFEADWRFAK